MENKIDSIEYLDGPHLYLIDGVITPSVSQIIRYIIPNKYASVPKHILDAACTFGTNVHNAIEQYEKLKPFELTDEERACFYGYLKLKQDHNIIPFKQEELLRYEDYYCGRLDMIGLVQDRMSLIDVKTTAKLNEDMLEWQLGLYALGYEYCYGIVFEEFYCLWLPKKGEPKLVPIKPKSKEEIMEMLKAYRKENQE